MDEIKVDNGGRRSGIDRRQFSYSGYLPERRSGEDRRNGKDRRAERHTKKKASTDENFLEMRRGND
ncbi:MAG: hypothetical protein KJ737_15935 [Proteobacteria bacterium]|nr:hypothetical protein [Pseudomonadota bacterium]